MLPLHRPFRNFISASFLLLLFASCSDRSDTDLAIIKTLIESIEYSNKNISASTIDVLSSFQKKLNDDGSRERAAVWYPKAQLIQKISKDAIDKIEKIKVKLDKQEEKIVADDSMALYEILIDYKEKILQVDPRLTNDFRRYLKIFTDAIDSSKNDQKYLLKNYFSGASTYVAKAMLVKLQNNIIINEQRMITYCYDYCGSTCGPWYEAYHAFVALNSAVVQPGERIEITAGMLSFTSNQKPQVFVYGRPVALSEDTFAHYKLKAASKPGKYYVPVKINYIDQNGKLNTIVKEMEYTVAKIEKQ